MPEVLDTPIFYLYFLPFRVIESRQGRVRCHVFLGGTYGITCGRTIFCRTEIGSGER